MITQNLIFSLGVITCLGWGLTLGQDPNAYLTRIKSIYQAGAGVDIIFIADSSISITNQQYSCSVDCLKDVFEIFDGSQQLGSYRASVAFIKNGALDNRLLIFGFTNDGKFVKDTMERFQTSVNRVQNGIDRGLELAYNLFVTQGNRNNRKIVVIATDGNNWGGYDARIVSQIQRLLSINTNIVVFGNRVSSSPNLPPGIQRSNLLDVNDFCTFERQIHLYLNGNH